MCVFCSCPHSTAVVDEPWGLVRLTEVLLKPAVTLEIEEVEQNAFPWPGVVQRFWTRLLSDSARCQPAGSHPPGWVWAGVVELH